MVLYLYLRILPSVMGWRVFFFNCFFITLYLYTYLQSTIASLLFTQHNPTTPLFLQFAVLCAACVWRVELPISSPLKPCKAKLILFIPKMKHGSKHDFFCTYLNKKTQKPEHGQVGVQHTNAAPCISVQCCAAAHSKARYYPKLASPQMDAGVYASACVCVCVRAHKALSPRVHSTINMHPAACRQSRVASSIAYHACRLFCSPWYAHTTI